MLGENMIKEMTEDEVRDLAGKILKFENTDKAQSGVGQLTSFNQLGFNGIKDRPDGWYLPKNIEEPAIILETKNSNQKLENFLDEVIKNCDIVSTKYNKVIGILYNGIDVIVLKNNEVIEAVDTLQNKDYYLSLFKVNKIDKQKIYGLTKKINDCLHTEFGIKNLYHRMIFTACALVAKRYGAMLIKGMNYPTFHTLIHSTLSKSLEDSRRQNQKLDILLEVYSEIKMNSTENQEAIDNFIEWISEISECVNSDYWNGEDVMGIFFNEFNRYKKKSESGQVFTPEHITSLMYRLIDVHQDDRVLDAACGSGGFLVKSMSNMIKESGGIQTDKAKKIKSQQLFGIEFDREIFALACANMLIHKDGKTNLEQLDSRTLKAGEWMREKKITKVLMNPPFERKYGCLKIVENVLDNVPQHTMCAFILPDKKLEKDNSASILKHHQLQKIVKLPEKVFSEGVTTSVFIFEAGIPQNNKEIFACYIEDDGLETVKNQGRHDIKDRWQEIEDRFVDVVHKQNGDDTIQWINPNKHLSYQMPEKEFEIYEEDFSKTMMDYIMYQEGIDAKEFSDKLIEKVMYSSCVAEDGEDYVITLKGDNKDEK
jgi:type I restriction enzyme M protein